MGVDIRRQLADRQLLVELFAVINMAGLAGDIFLAHSENHFRNGWEYVPLGFSGIATLVLALILPLRRRVPAVWRDVGHLIGWLAIAVGFVGVVLHLDSRFFYERTLKSLTYAAPFAAPLAYTGLGLLVIANRLVDPASREWSGWIAFLALGGFVGNFVFSLMDHAQNGFFNPAEWIAGGASALAIGVLVTPFLVDVPPAYVRLYSAVLLIEIGVGMLGLVLHVRGDLRQPAPTVMEQVLGGAPPIAPLLFVNLSVLAAIGLLPRSDPQS